MNKIPLLAALSLLALAGCSNLSSLTSSTADVSLAGTVGGTASLLTLNGQPLNLSGASITVDEEPGSPGDVKPGVEVSGDGSDDGGKLKMRRLEVRWRAKGAVDAVDAVGGTVDVVGLRAKITDTTLLVREAADGSETPITLADLKVGDFVKVAGLPQADDSIQATRLEVKVEDNPNKVDLRVRVRDLKSDLKTFSYGLKTYTVDFSAPSVRIVGTVANDGFVRVKGQRQSSTVLPQLVQGVPSANPGNPTPPVGRRVELKGLISGLNKDAKTFKVQDFTVDYSRALVRGTLEDGKTVEVNGLATGANAVQAVRVEVQGAGGGDQRPERPGREARLEGAISAFDGTALTLKIANLSVTVKPTTKYEIADAEVSAATFWGTNRDGSRAEARGQIAAGTFTADKLEIK